MKLLKKDSTASMVFVLLLVLMTTIGTIFADEPQNAPNSESRAIQTAQQRAEKEAISLLVFASALDPIAPELMDPPSAYEASYSVGKNAGVFLVLAGAGTTILGKGPLGMMKRSLGRIFFFVPSAGLSSMLTSSASSLAAWYFFFQDESLKKAMTDNEFFRVVMKYENLVDNDITPYVDNLCDVLGISDKSPAGLKKRQLLRTNLKMELVRLANLDSSEDGKPYAISMSRVLDSKIVPAAVRNMIVDLEKVYSGIVSEKPSISIPLDHNSEDLDHLKSVISNTVSIMQSMISKSGLNSELKKSVQVRLERALRVQKEIDLILAAGTK